MLRFTLQTAAIVQGVFTGIVITSPAKRSISVDAPKPRWQPRQPRFMIQELTKKFETKVNDQAATKETEVMEE